MFLHRHEPDEAHALLQHSRATTEDPWLLAAEIALATVAGRLSRHIKLGRRMIESGRFSPFQTTELASAIATVDADAGKVKIAKQLFRMAMREPTENSVAQVQWVARKLGLLEFETSLLAVPRSFEANAWVASADRRWEDVLSATWEWLSDEPFAGRPAALGSVVAAVALNDPAQALRFVELALVANRTSADLLNNEVFALALDGQLDRAQLRHREIHESRLTDEDHVVYFANSGLLAFRSGDVMRARDEYDAAVTLARRQTDRKVEGCALAYWAAEEFRQRSMEVSTPVGPVDAAPNPRLAEVDAESLASRALEALRGAGKSVDRDLAELHLRRAVKPRVSGHPARP
ncbi:MAG TPA: hypothetical protein VNV25_09445 [Gemmatimonadaceae bacterium]|nr:hypothetical protein [Gemmatimonadaceae bacterium]